MISLMGKGRGRIIAITGFLLLYISFLFVIESRRSEYNSSGRDHGLCDLPPVLLSAVAGEFKGMLASYIILDAGSRVGTQIDRAPDGSNMVVSRPYICDPLYKMIKASQYLDSAFAQTYNFSHGWLPWLPCKMVEEDTKILQTAQANRPWDLFPTQYMAFNSYYFLNDYKRAGEILLEEAANRKNAPSYLSIIGSRLSKKGGNTAAALVFLKSIVAHKAPE